MRILLLLLGWAFVPLSVAAKVPDRPRILVEPLPPGTQTRPVQLSKIIVKLSRGEPFGKLKLGLLCIGAGPLTWKVGRGQLDIEDFDQVFKDELDKIGFDVVSAGGEMFDSGRANNAEYLVGGTIRALAVDACFPRSGLGDLLSAKGSALMDIEWHIFDRLERRVVDRFESKAIFAQAKAQSGGIEAMLYSAFAENVRALAASGKLQKILVGSPADPGAARVPLNGLAPIVMSPPGAGVRDIDDAVGATVLVQSGDGHGTGFLISKEGYFLTNAHVVGAGKFVKLRWSDGIESLGEVIRVDRGRDVALVKGDSRGRNPIRLAVAKPAVGSDMFAIGAPLDREMQNTVTRGILSANRIMDGYAYLQSDVSVAPGNSGGPLVDRRGDLLGITVAGMRINNASQGLNFFIPAQEALDFLAISGVIPAAK